MEGLTTDSELGPSHREGILLPPVSAVEVTKTVPSTCACICLSVWVCETYIVHHLVLRYGHEVWSEGQEPAGPGRLRDRFSTWEVQQHFSVFFLFVYVVPFILLVKTWKNSAYLWCNLSCTVWIQPRRAANFCMQKFPTGFAGLVYFTMQYFWFRVGRERPFLPFWVLIWQKYRVPFYILVERWSRARCASLPEVRQMIPTLADPAPPGYIKKGTLYYFWLE